MSARAVYIDVDDVLSATTEGLVRLLEVRHGKRLTIEDVTDFDLRKSFGLSEKEHDALLDAAHGEDFIEGLDVVAGSPEVVSHWRDEGYAVRVVTGRPPDAMAATRRWLERVRIRHDELWSVDKYDRHNGAPGSVRLEALAAETFALAIEDSLPMARFLVEHTGAHVALMDRPWNRHPVAAVHPRITRVHTWVEIQRLFHLP